jgi:hypothetical protein
MKTINGADGKARKKVGRKSEVENEIEEILNRVWKTRR